ncbi:MAG: hypothetical protein JWN23_2834 [Rhodocyclales bacterium]|nr:hypothetical protein [Rhodocyclales bacterium]
MNNSVHFVLQGKGGIGKTLVSALLAQYVEHKEPESLRCFDTDQENATFASYIDLNVELVDVMNTDRTINRKMFDKMLLSIFESDKNIVIDNGANTFSPLMSYLMENSFLGMLQEAGKKVYIHTIIGGGDNLKDTTAGFASLAMQTKCSMVIWLNENASWGTTENFIESELFAKHSANVCGVVLLQGRNSDTFGDDIRRMNKSRMTLKQILANPSFNILERSRLKTVVLDVFEKLDAVAW